jgi:GT2 family glycosyltransferase
LKNRRFPATALSKRTILNPPDSDAMEEAQEHLAKFAPVAIILLNWNGWNDTIECLESVFRMNYPRFRVIVCDNASTDGSMEHIRAWAGGRLNASCGSSELSRLLDPPIPKPVDFASISRVEVGRRDTRDTPLVLIETGANLGFAGANNLGLQHALSQPGMQYFWVLNNDTVVEPDALSALIDAMEADPDLGLCGSVLRDYNSPDCVLTLGGRAYNRWTGRSRPIKDPTPDGRPIRLDYVEGASVLVRREFLETVGLMAEDYFLYFEEMDWAMRARGQFRWSYSPGSIVYHKEGASIGSHRNRRERSTLADFFQSRNRLAFTWRFCPLLFPIVLMSVAATAVHRSLTGRWRNAAAVVKGIFAALKFRRAMVP